MTYTAHDGSDTTFAGIAHLGAMVGPIIPLAVWLARRNEDRFSRDEAAKAANFGMAVLVTLALATVVRVYVPLVAFLGTLAQLVVLVVAIFFTVQAHRNVRRGAPASYPFNLKVVKTND